MDSGICKYVFVLLLLMQAMRINCNNFTMFLAHDDLDMQNSISTLPCDSEVLCAITCNGELDCASYMYIASAKTCSLYKENPESAPSEVETSPGKTLYVKHKACEQGWIRLLSSCYLFSLEYRSWEASKAYCESIGATLVTVQNDVEHQFLRHMSKRLHPQGYIWIGARYDFSAGEHLWVDGTKMTFNGWQPGLPGTSKGCVDYLDLFDWLWNSHSDCVNTFGPCICEMRR